MPTTINSSKTTIALLTKWLILLCIILSPISLKAQYESDILGGAFLQKSIKMPDDYEGEVKITLIRETSGLGSWDAVLYIHGFNDYFFQEETSAYFTQKGFNFYAVDLRKYGRSWMEHQKKGNIRNINEYFEDIDSAIHHIKAEGNETLLLLGHSTGGLVASLYLDQLDRKNDDSQTPFITGLILNSPFLDMNMRWMTEKVGVPLVAGLGMVAPNYKLPIKDNGMYGRSIHHKYKGEWEYNLKWKQLSPPIYASWLKAIYAGHRKVKHGLHITQPILVLYSTQSVYGKTWQEDFRLGDAVLDVNDIEKLGKKLGKNVQTAAIQDGLHDLALSNREARKKYYKEIDKWIDKNIKNLSIYAP